MKKVPFKCSFERCKGYSRKRFNELLFGKYKVLK